MLIWSTIALCVFASFCLAPWVEAEVELGCRRSIFADEGEVAAKVRKFAPDRLVDVLHMKLDVTPDFRARRVAGETTLRFAPIARPLRELRLHAVDLEIASVEGSVPISGHRVTEEELVVTFAEELPPGEEQWVTIAHAAEPEKGLYFRTPEMGYKPQDTHLWTQGESHEARHWYPSFDYPNERFTTEMICRVPEDMVVLSNGRKVGEEIDPETGLKAVAWLQDKPHVNYLVALMAGKFAGIEDRHGEIPLGFYTPASQIEWAGNAFAPTAAIMAFFEREIGVPYPWDQYNQVVVDDFTWGGMENTTLTVLADWALYVDETENVDTSQWLIAHELAHQWFGDYVTCKDWTHLWLNEGFASYYENLYEGQRSGRDGLLYAMYTDARKVIGTDDRRPIAFREYENPENQFDRRAYEKGSWVLHMLRARLGDELYRECIRTYLERNALRSVVTEDLNRVIEELSGRSFDRFFDQWVYHGGLPKLEVEYSWDEVAKLAKVSLEQVQEVDDQVLLFRFPTQVRFEMEDGTVDREMAVTGKRHDFYFPLEQQPRVVRFDPEYGLLAEVAFDKPKEMLYAQLAESDVIGRLRAVEALREKEDGKTVEALAAALNGDLFYGVRIEASKALREIHMPKAFAALATAREQADARVRRQVVRDIAGFYREEGAAVLREIIEGEKNPAIREEAIRGLGKYPGKETGKLLLKYLRSESYRNRLAGAAIGAIRALDDPEYVEPLRKGLANREKAFTSRRFGEGLEALAYIARHRENKKEVRLFLAEYADHPKKEIQRRAIVALGILRDPAAIPLVESFVGSGEEKNRLERAAEGALGKLRDARKLPVELGALREEVLQLKEESEKVREELEDLKKKLEAEEER